ncbi:MAG TPA: phage head closure protein [Caulobacterales bacterium]|nr:phage head closure protein [Caulobacterales bacterium]
MGDAIGALRARVLLQSPARAQDDLGGAARAWSDEGAVWAEITALGASQGADFDAAPSTASYRVMIRPRVDVRAGWRLAWGARTLTITGVSDAGERRITLQCEEERL